MNNNDRTQRKILLQQDLAKFTKKLDATLENMQNPNLEVTDERYTRMVERSQQMDRKIAEILSSIDRLDELGTGPVLMTPEEQDAYNKRVADFAARRNNES